MTVTTLPSVSAQSPAPLSPSELAAWRAYVETVTDLNSALEGDLARAGLSLGDYQVLVYLSESPDGSMRMVDLACRLQLSPSGLTRRLDGLVKNGHVHRDPSATDRRVMLAVITDSGHQVLATAYPAHLASVRFRIIDRLAPDDIDALTRIFTAIAAGLQGEGDSDNAVVS